MNGYLLAVAIVLIGLAVAHSVIGEAMLLRHMNRFQGLPHLFGSDSFAKQTIRVTWHVPSIFALVLASIAARLSTELHANELIRFAGYAMGIGFAVCTVLTMALTRFKHPAGIVFGLLTVLCIVGVYHA